MFCIRYWFHWAFYQTQEEIYYNLLILCVCQLMPFFNDAVNLQIMGLWFIFSQVYFDKGNINSKKDTTCWFHYLLMTIRFLYLLDDHHKLILRVIIIDFIIISWDGFIEFFEFFTTKFTPITIFSENIDLILNDAHIMPFFWK